MLDLIIPEVREVNFTSQKKWFKRVFNKTVLKWSIPFVLFGLFCAVATTLRLLFTLEDVDKWALLSTAFARMFGATSTWEEVMATSTHAFTPIYPALAGFFIVMFGDSNYLTISIVISLVASAGSVIVMAVLSRDWIVTSLYATATAMMFDAAGWQETMPITVFASSVYVLITIKKKYSLAIPVALLLIFTREILWPFVLVPPIICLLEKNRKWATFIKTTLLYTLIPVGIYAAWIFGSGAFDLMAVRYERVAWWNWQRSPLNFAVAFLVSTGPMALVFLRANRFTRDDLPMISFVVIFMLSRLVMDGPFLGHYFEPMILATSLLWRRGGKERFLVLIINVALIFAIEFLALLSWVNAMMNFMTNETVLFGQQGPIVEG